MVRVMVTYIIYTITMNLIVILVFNGYHESPLENEVVDTTIVLTLFEQTLQSSYIV